MRTGKLLILFVAISVFISGCGKTEEEINVDNLQRQSNELTRQIKKKQEEKDSVQRDIESLKTANNYERYVLTLNISQSHFTLDISQHLKDAMNDISMQIPVDKAFYDNVSEGQVLKDDFRFGSLLFKGSFGSWNVKIVKKEVMR